MTTGTNTTARVNRRKGVLQATSSAIRYPPIIRMGVR